MVNKYFLNKFNIFKVTEKFNFLEMQHKKNHIFYSIHRENRELNCKGKKMTKSGHFYES